MKIGIVGGGAAGFFAAIAAKENYPDANVVIFEKSFRLCITQPRKQNNAQSPPQSYS